MFLRLVTIVYLDNDAKSMSKTDVTAMTMVKIDVNGFGHCLLIHHLLVQAIPR